MEDRFATLDGRKQHEADLGVVESQVQEGGVEFPVDGEGPGLGAGGVQGVGVVPLRSRSTATLLDMTIIVPRR